MSTIEIKNAIIKSTKITTDDGWLGAWIFLDYGGSGQGFGCTLYLPASFKNHDKGGNYAGHFIWRVLEIAGVSEWSRLPGKTIRVRGTHGGIEAIGHIVKDDWFDPKIELSLLDGKP